ncbi:MAG: hypothetical protein PHE67_04635 [Campylobacterales bacterium]|nr:hypothetical protein [Campylobacterales bacterium]
MDKNELKLPTKNQINTWKHASLFERYILVEAMSFFTPTNEIEAIFGLKIKDIKEQIHYDILKRVIVQGFDYGVIDTINALEDFLDGEAARLVFRYLEITVGKDAATKKYYELAAKSKKKENALMFDIYGDLLKFSTHSKVAA